MPTMATLRARIQIINLVAILCLAPAMAVLAVPPKGVSTETRHAVIELSKIARTGEVEQALDLFVEQKKQAEKDDRLVEYVLSSGPIFEPLLSPDTPHASAWPLFAAYWEEIIPKSSGNLRLRAVNDCGVLLVAAGRNEFAVHMLTNLSPETHQALKRADDASASQFQANAGVALERTGAEQAALEKFFSALERDASSRPARAGIERRISDLAPAEGLSTRIALASRLREARQLEAAGNTLKQAMAQIAKENLGPAARPLLPELVRYFNAVPVGAKAVLKYWAPELKEMYGAVTDSDTKALIKELLTIHERPGETAIDGSRLWSSRHPRLFSRLLLRLGQNRERSDSKTAANLYYRAWQLDPENFDAVIYLVNLLGDKGASVDPESRLLGEIVAELFEAKHQAYRAGDLEEIARLHAILGTIYDRKGQWGSPNKVDSAIFQWQGALDARRALARQRKAKGKPAPSVSPGLHAHLAQAYAEADPERWNERAFRHYSSAAEGYLTSDQPEAADLMVKQARQVRPNLTEPEIRQLEGLQEQVKSLRQDVNTQATEAGEGADMKLRDEIYQRLQANPTISGNWKEIDVQVDAGKAVIRGVPHEKTPTAERQSIEILEQQAQSVPGIKGVTVEREPPP